MMYTFILQNGYLQFYCNEKSCKFNENNTCQIKHCSFTINISDMIKEKNCYHYLENRTRNKKILNLNKIII